MAWALPQDTATLTPAEQKILQGDKIIHKFTKSQWETFACWVNTNNPNVPDTQLWLAENNIDSDPSFLCTILLTKLAASAAR